MNHTFYIIKLLVKQKMILQSYLDISVSPSIFYYDIHLLYIYIFNCNKDRDSFICIYYISIILMNINIDINTDMRNIKYFFTKNSIYIYIYVALI